MSDHTDPIPPNGHLADGWTEANHSHLYEIPPHTHEHSGWQRWRSVLALALVVVFAVGAIVRVESISRRDNRRIVALTTQIAEQSESNCRARDAQLRQAVASSTAGRTFFAGLGRRLRAERAPRSADYMAGALGEKPTRGKRSADYKAGAALAIKPPKPPPPADCDFPEPEGASG